MPCLTRNAWSGSIGAALAAPPIFPQANNAAPEKNPETSSPTNPAHRAQTAHVRGQVPEPQYARANLVHARSPQTAAPAGVRKRHGHRWMYKSLPPCRTVPHLASKDRKSTRLNSSHVKISYAVFCLKKKKKNKNTDKNSTIN